jgi:hypothetical protein
MSDICETVKIASENAPGGYVLINKSDFDPEIHKPYEAPTHEGAGDDANAPKPTGRAPKTPKPNPEN